MPTLTAVLSDLLRSAEASPGEKRTAHLGSGLVVDLKVDGGQTYLQIHRSSIYPSRAEWATVLKHWPYPIHAEPQPLKHYGRHYLKASWPSQPPLGLDVCAQTPEE